MLKHSKMFTGCVIEHLPCYALNIVNTQIDHDKINAHEKDIKPLYAMSLELENGNSKSINIFHNSNPTELAFDFCRLNNLDFNSMKYLENEIDILLHKNANEDCDDNIKKDEEWLIEDRLLSLSSIHKTKNSFPNSNEKQSIENVNINPGLVINNNPQNIQPQEPLFTHQENEEIHLDGKYEQEAPAKSSEKNIFEGDNALQSQKVYGRSISNRSVGENMSSCSPNCQNQTIPKPNVFDRLFNDAEYKRSMPKKSNSCIQLSNISSSNVNTSQRKKFQGKRNSSKSPMNYGEYLYIRGKALLEKKEKCLEKIRIANEEKKQEYLTFQPNINEYHSINRKPQLNLGDYLSNKREVLQNKEKAQRHNVQLSNHFNNSKNNRKRLNNEEKRKMQAMYKKPNTAKEKYREEYTFKPTINHNASFLAEIHERKIEQSLLGYKSNMK